MTYTHVLVFSTDSDTWSVYKPGDVDLSFDSDVVTEKSLDQHSGGI